MSNPILAKRRPEFAAARGGAFLCAPVLRSAIIEGHGKESVCPPRAFLGYDGNGDRRLAIAIHAACAPSCHARAVLFAGVPPLQGYRSQRPDALGSTCRVMRS